MAGVSRWKRGGNGDKRGVETGTWKRGHGNRDMTRFFISNLQISNRRIPARGRRCLEDGYGKIIPAPILSYPVPVVFVSASRRGNPRSAPPRGRGDGGAASAGAPLALGEWGCYRGRLRGVIHFFGLPPGRNVCPRSYLFTIRCTHAGLPRGLLRTTACRILSKVGFGRDWLTWGT